MADTECCEGRCWHMARHGVVRSGSERCGGRHRRRRACRRLSDALWGETQTMPGGVSHRRADKRPTEGGPRGEGRRRLRRLSVALDRTDDSSSSSSEVVAPESWPHPGATGTSTKASSSRCREHSVPGMGENAQDPALGVPTSSLARRSRRLRRVRWRQLRLRPRPPGRHHHRLQGPAFAQARQFWDERNVVHTIDEVMLILGRAAGDINFACHGAPERLEDLVPAPSGRWVRQATRRSAHPGTFTGFRAVCSAGHSSRCDQKGDDAPL